MKKRVQLIILSILMFTVIFVVLSSSIFSFSEVGVDYLTTHIKTNLTTTEALEGANLKTGKSIFFINKTYAKNNLEKQNPFIKIVNIETVFPNKLIFHVAERKELFAIKLNDKYLILDEDCKILQVCDNYVNNAENAILLENFITNNTKSQNVDDISSQNNESQYQEGDFLLGADTIKNLARILQEWKLSFAHLKAHIISISNLNNNLILNMRCGLEIKVFNLKENLSNKLNLAFSVYEKAEDVENKTLLEIRNVKNANDEYELKGFIS